MFKVFVLASFGIGLAIYSLSVWFVAVALHFMPIRFVNGDNVSIQPVELTGSLTAQPSHLQVGENVQEQ